MIIGNRTLTTRYILPFIFDSDALFTDKYSFVNAYVEDINRPYIENTIMVLFEYNTEVYDKVDKELKGNKYYYGRNEVHINDVFYLEYMFVIPPEFKSTINVIKDGKAYCLPYDTKLRILNFWKNINLSYMRDLLTEKKDLTEVKSLYDLGEVVTEEDYVENANDLALQYIFGE